MTLSHSPVDGDGLRGLQEASVYTYASGAIVFNAATNYWSYFLEGNEIGGACSITRNARVERMTRSVLDTMLTAAGDVPPPTTTTTVPTTTAPTTTTTAPTTTTRATTTTTRPPSTTTTPPTTTTTRPSTATSAQPTTSTAPAEAPAAARYRLVADDGRSCAYGSAAPDGDPAVPDAPVAAAAAGTGSGWWMVTVDGHVRARGGPATSATSTAWR